MIKVHHLNNSRSQRILWLLEELGLDYEIIRYQRHPQTHLAPDSLKRVHPLGKSPLIEDGGFVVVESGAIIEYLVEAYGAGHSFLPEELHARTDAKKWLHYSEGSLMPFLVMKLVLSRVNEAKIPFILKPVARKIVDGIRKGYLTPNLESNVAYLVQHLENREFFVGDQVTIADFGMIFPLEALVTKDDGLLDERGQNIIRDYCLRIQQRPAYQRALEKGGDYDYLVRR